MRLSGTKLSAINQYRGLGNQLYDLAGERPSLDLPFADQKSLVDAARGSQPVTFTRASSGTYVDSQGVIRTATTNEARFDHNPTTGESLGLLVEEQRTNSIRNNTMVGAVAGTPGTLPTNWFTFTSLTGLTQQIVGTGTENGIAYIDYKLSGTASGRGPCNIFLEALGQAVAAENQVWTTSSYFKLAGGSLSNIEDIRIASQSRTAGGSYIAQYSSVATIGSTLARAANTSPALPATTERIVPLVIFNIASAAAIDITLRIGLPQLEQGAFATSVIPTTTAAATRSADVASITGANFSSWYRQDEGTVFASYSASTPLKSTRFSSPIALSDGTTANRIVAVFNSDATSNYLGMFAANAGATQVNANTSIADSQLNFRHVVAFALNNYTYAFNGGTAAAGSAGTVPVVDRATFGTGPSSNILNGTIRRLTYWPQRLSNITLQQITQ